MDLQKNPEKALSLAEQDKASLLLEATQDKRSYKFGGVPDSLTQEEKSLNNSLSQIEAKLLTVKDENQKNKLLSLLNKKSIKVRKLKALIQKKYPKYAAFKYDDQIVKLEEIQAKLPAKTAVLEYVLSKNHLFTFLISSSETKILIQDINSDSLAKQIQLYHSALSDYSSLYKNDPQSKQLYKEKAHWFYQQTIAPVKTYMKEVEHLIIIPDNELGHLPFESFLVEQPEMADFDFAGFHYLLKDYSISYDYSLTLWNQNNDKKSKQNNKKILGIASNYSKIGGENRGIDRLPVYRNLGDHLQALPAARAEVERLAKDYSGYFAFDSLASERNFKAIAKDYAIIHLAMHGLLNQKEPILSSLAFTEDGDSLENNFLQAYEISKMELNADLVVLSACETGYGRFERGNGIASLARSFMYAGVPALVVSLWQVNDASTSIVMKNFYDKLAEGLNKAEALRQAKLDYIESAAANNPIAAHPAFWAAFVQLGNSQAIQIPKKVNASWIWWTVGGGALLFAALGFAFRKRKSRQAA